ncbi:MAG: hypothetical protein ACTSRG_24875 [Candidatus Helarchaeota archaeon]
MNDINKIIIEQLNPNNENDWEEFNEKIEGGSFFHTLKWKTVLEKSFGCKPYYFLVYRNKKVISICPFYEYNIKFLKGLVPLPHSDCCYLLIDKKNWSKYAVKKILLKAKKISKQHKVSFIFVNNLDEKINNRFIEDFSPLYHHVQGNMTLDLSKIGPKKIWHDIFTVRAKGRPRKFIRVFEKENFKIKKVETIKDLEIFYKYYKANLEFKNAKPYDFSHFKILWNTYSSEEMIITLLHKNDFIIGGLLAFLFPPKKTMNLRYLSINRNVPNRYHQTYLLYWDAVLRASNLGYRTVNFGSTANNPNDRRFRIKASFGCSFEEIHSVFICLSNYSKFMYNLYKFIRKIPFFHIKLFFPY